MMSAAAIPTCGGGHVAGAVPPALPRRRPTFTVDVEFDWEPRCPWWCPVRVRDEADIQRALTRTRPFTVIFEAPVIPLAVEPDPPGIVARRPRRGERKPKEQP